MNRVMAAMAVVVGILAMIQNKRFGDAGIETSRRFYRIDLPPGTRRRAFTIWYGRILAVVVGAAMVVLGTLGAVGVIHPH
ncbi:hypothetical protein ACFFWC_13655 [Plantactinospora siamensis]|uniref:Uncharacterized protein n=1 Tax=Plantactinospora siamensis TaxID=555372 RepID=A0ABV6P4K4_9ACTN